MTVISCKMCGGDMELLEDMTHGRCQYCGSIMTLPKIDDEQRASAFNRGNHFRRIGEFDKAVSVYERIVNENNADAEAHWCLALSRFGIEYVKDPVSGEYKPTCHRASYDSFLEDVDYQAALEYSDGVTRRQYEEDARKIMEVQKGLLAISRREEEFDIFICYKESDDTGNRTKDSVLAQDIYYQLTEQGYRVFFSRITLEDKAGMEYEPYIFAALHSARVMIVVGTKPEYLNAVWVKNEWSRYLAFMKQDKNKLILPCYRDMDPYDMPEQLSILQAYDMGKIGFVQDLLHGIRKVLKKDEPEKVTERVVVTSGEPGENRELLLQRGNMALEDKEFDEAYNLFEQVLNHDVECAEAYLGKKLAREKCRDLVEFVRVRTKVSAEQWDVIRERDITDDPKWREYVADCVSKCQNKYPDLGEEAVTGIVSAVCDVDLWKRAAFWEKCFQDFQVEKESDSLLKRVLQYGDRELCQMLNKQLDDIMGVLEKKAQEETVGKAKHLRWVEEQIEVFADKQKELKKLEENFQETLKQEDPDKLQGYSPKYKKLAEYFKSVSRTTEADFCERRASQPQLMMEYARQCNVVISKYLQQRNKQWIDTYKRKAFFEKYKKEFEKCMQDGKEDLLEGYDFCRKYYEDCERGIKYTEAVKRQNKGGAIFIVIIVIIIFGFMVINRQ